MDPLEFHSLGTFCARASPLSSGGGDEMRMGKSSLSVVFAAMPRGVAYAVDSLYTRDGSGVAPGANTFFIVLCGRFGEKGTDAGGLSEMADARKMLRAVAMLLLLRLLDGGSSRVVKNLRDGAECGVPRRFDGPLPNGEAAPYARFANGSGGRALGVPLVAGAASFSPGSEKVTMSNYVASEDRWERKVITMVRK